MRTISLLIFGLWYLAIATRVVALGALVWRRLALTYLGFALLLLTGSVRSATLLFSLWTGGADAYRHSWITSQALEVGMYAIVTLEAFYLQARHFPKVRWFGVSTAILFSLISAIIVFSVAGFHSGYWKGSAQYIEIATRNYTAICLMMLTLSWWLFDFLGMRRNVVEHVRLLALLFAGETASAILIFWLGEATWVMVASQLIRVTVPIACYVRWAMLKATGESYAPASIMSERDSSSLIGDLQQMREAVDLLRASRVER